MYVTLAAAAVALAGAAFVGVVCLHAVPFVEVEGDGGVVGPHPLRECEADMVRRAQLRDRIPVHSSW